MSRQDLTSFLHDWPHEHGRINARRITGDDGRDKLQVRIDLGVLQMEIDGRPDGQRPHSFDSLLEYQHDRLARYQAESGSRTGFILSEEECRHLREEAVQFYHRYVALFALEDFERVQRDTNRNLQVFDLCHAYAETDLDRSLLEQFRPHVVTMRTRAEAEMALRQKKTNQAIEAIDRGMAELRTWYAETGQQVDVPQTNEMLLLAGMREALVPKLPTSQRAELEERLRAALAAENYELAAILRDELRLLGD